MNKEKFISEAKARRKKIIEPILLEVLTKMLSENVRYLDARYIESRSLEIIEKTIVKLKFNSAEIQKVRRAFLDVLIDGATKQLYGFDDEEKEAKKNIHNEELRDKASENLKRLERIKSKNPADKTETRDMECEPVCQLVAATVLGKKLLLSDEEFVNNFIEMDNELLLSSLAKILFEELFDQMIFSLDDSYIRANEKNWGCRRDEIKLSQIDNRLKS